MRSIFIEILSKASKIFAKKDNIREPEPSTYLFFNRYISHKLRIIIECGSRDGLDAIALYEKYTPQQLFSFECNPESIPVCKNNLREYANIHLIEKATFDLDGEIDFYATDMDKSIDKNIGASSILQHRDNKEQFFQRKIRVNAIRLDSFMALHSIEKIDLLCCDLQGTEINTFMGLGSRIKDVHYIITEVSYKSYYHNDVLFQDLVCYLSGKGFTLLKNIDYGGFGDAIFINKDFDFCS